MDETNIDTRSPEPLNDGDIDRISRAINHWHTNGAPEKAAVLRECLEQNRKPPANLVYFGEVQPETGVDASKLSIPPREGPGAVVAVWREFAKATTDMEPEIIAKMQRKDLIHMLETKGIIPKVEKTAK